MRLIGLFCLTLLFAIQAKGQTIDSLKQLLNKPANDTTKGNLYAEIANAYYNFDGNLDSALENYSKAVKWFGKKKHASGLSLAHTGLGLIYREKGIYDKSLMNYLKGLEYGKKSKSIKRISKALIGIGVVHHIQGDTTKALYHYREAEQLNLKHKNISGLASIYNNVGLLYSDAKKYETAINYFNKGLKINTELNDQRGIATNCENIGLIYLNDLNDPGKAMENFSRSVALWRGMKDRLSISITLQYISSALFKMNKFKACNDTALLSLQLSKEAHSLSSEMAAHKWTYLSFEKLQQSNKAFEHYKKYVQLKDSLRNEEEIRSITSMQVKYDMEQQKAVDSLKTEARHQVEVSKKQLALEQQQKFILWLGLGLFLTLVFVVFIYIMLMKNKKARKEIALQKMLIEQRNLEVLDSIKYASRIQQAILPPQEQLKKLLPHHFILYLPKDIVSGDFYWVEEKDNRVFFAVVDCTGHGVPGAFMSIVGRNGLTDAVKIANLIHADDILNYLNKYVNEALHQRYEKSAINDGMDLALCVWNKTNNQLEFAGANNPLWIKKQNSNTIEEIKGDKQPIGSFIYSSPDPFTKQIIDINKGDVLYLFSDGYADQFGGTHEEKTGKGKKFKYKRLKETLIKLSNNTLQSQHDELNRIHQNWKGDIQQIDDICVMGIKID